MSVSIVGTTAKRPTRSSWMVSNTRRVFQRGWIADCIPFISVKIIMLTPNPCERGSTCRVVASGGTVCYLGLPEADHRSLRDHHPLGLSRGARGVEQKRELVGAAVDQRVDRLGGSHQRGQILDRRPGRVTDGARGASVGAEAEREDVDGERQPAARLDQPRRQLSRR